MGTGNIVHQFRVPDIVWAVDWSPTGEWIASGGDDGKVYLWNVQDVQQSVRLEDADSAIFGIAWSADGRSIACAYEAPVISIWAGTPKRFQYRYHIHERELKALVWSPDNRWLASSSYDFSVQVVNAVTGQREMRYQHYDAVFDVAWSPDSEALVSLCPLETDVHVWKRTTGQRLFVLHDGDAFEAGETVDWSPDGSMIVAGGRYGVIWDVASRQVQARFHGHQGPSSIRAIAFSPCSRYVAFAADDRVVRIWRVEDGEEVYAFTTHTGTWVRSLAWSPDGSMIVSADDAGTILVWETK